MPKKRVRATQCYTKGPKGDQFSDWHLLATHKQIDFCCDCGLAHEVQFAAFRRKVNKIGRLLPRESVVVARRVRLAPRRTAAKRRAKRLRPIAQAIKAS